MAAMMASEIRDPARTIPRGRMADLGVRNRLLFGVHSRSARPAAAGEEISELNGLAEAGESAGAALGAAWIAPVIAILVLVSAVGQFGGTGTTVSRVCRSPRESTTSCPAAFGRLHVRWGTPHISILTFGAVASFLLLIFQLGDSLRAAYQEMVSMMVITGFLPVPLHLR
ncbi:MAG: hypothetical protein WDO73_37850 [Ignavibacteriota bacterium]